MAAKAGIGVKFSWLKRQLYYVQFGGGNSTRPLLVGSDAVVCVRLVCSTTEFKKNIGEQASQKLIESKRSEQWGIECANEYCVAPTHSAPNLTVPEVKCGGGGGIRWYDSSVTKSIWNETNRTSVQGNTCILTEQNDGALSAPSTPHLITDYHSVWSVWETSATTECVVVIVLFKLTKKTTLAFLN